MRMTEILIWYRAIFNIFSQINAKGTCEFNTLRMRQNACHFPDDILKWIFLNENVWILIKISSKFVPRVQLMNLLPCNKYWQWKPITFVNSLWWPQHVVMGSNCIKYLSILCVLTVNKPFSQTGKYCQRTYTIISWQVSCGPLLSLAGEYSVGEYVTAIMYIVCVLANMVLQIDCLKSELYRNIFVNIFKNCLEESVIKSANIRF